MRQFFLLGLLTLLFPFALSAQNITVSGKVFDSSTNEPLVGVTVVQTGTQNGTITDIDGNYNISVPSDASLTFSYIGYITNTVFVNGKSTLPVSLDPDNKTLEQVVVVGYGTMKKSDVSGSVVSVDTKDMMKRAPQNVNQGLQGAAAGVQVTAQDGSPEGKSQVRIRGVATINGTAQPLYVVDGVQVGTDANFLNPADIESIEVLKDASATAIYGSAGANGVIMITTKHGQKGKMMVTATADFAVQTLPYKLDVVDIDTYAKIIRECRANDGAGINNQIWDQKYDGQRQYIDWQDQMTHNAFRQQYNISANGGTEASSYNFSIGYMDNEGLIVNTDYKRLNVRTSARSKINKYLEIGGDVNFIHSENSGSNIGVNNNGNLSSLRDLAYMAPTLDYVVEGRHQKVNVVNADGSYGSGYLRTSDGWEGNTSNNSNPYATQMEAKGISRNNRVLANAFAEITFFKGLSLRSIASYNMNSSEYDNFTGGRIRKNVDITDGQLKTITLTQDNRYNFDINQGQDNTIQVETYLTYKWKNDIHNFSIMAGHSVSKYFGYYVSASAKDLPYETTRETSLAFDDDSKNGNGKFNAETRGISYYGRLTYSLLDRYILTATVRRDGSSNFGNQNRWGVFPSAALAWRISEESFLKGNDVLSNLKLRLGWGQVGNAGGMAGKGFVSLQTRDVAYNYYPYGTAESGINSNRIKQVGYKAPIADEKLQWETNETTNIGLDFGFLNGKISGTFDYFMRTTKDLLLNKPTRPSTGYASVYSNFGTIKNSGVEISLTYTNKINNDLDFSITFNGSSIKNKIDDIGDQPIFAVNDVTTNDGSNVGAIGAPSGFHWDNHSISKNGSAVGSYYGYQVQGVIKDEAELKSMAKQNDETKVGDFRYVDQNNDGVINSDDMVILGDGFPAFNYGFNVNVNYKNWDFSLYCYGVAGMDIYSYSAMRLSNVFSSDDQTTPRILKDSYSDIQNGSLARLSWNDKNLNMRGSDAWVKKGDFFRISNIQVGYTLPKEWIAPALISNARVYVAIQNLAVFSSYKKYGDPECGQGSVLFTGLDTGRYPMPRTYMCGINLQF